MLAMSVSGWRIPDLKSQHGKPGYKRLEATYERLAESLQPNIRTAADLSGRLRRSCRRGVSTCERSSEVLRGY